MPNFSHGTAGIATALAIAGQRLGRPDLIEAAVGGTEHILSLADTADGGCRIPHVLPEPPTYDEGTYAYGWCGGPSGTRNLFSALEFAAVTEVGGRSCAEWIRCLLVSVRSSGIPQRLRPGFWDNDGRCCGTAGAADVMLDQVQRSGAERDFADELVAALVERAIPVGDQVIWRFIEYRNPEPLLPPGVGWSQGVAGISAVLFRYVRVQAMGASAPRQSLPDNFWTVAQS